MKGKTHKGNLESTFYMIIPLLLYISKSTISMKGKKSGRVLGIHITPFFTFGITYRYFNK